MNGKIESLLKQADAEQDGKSSVSCAERDFETDAAARESFDSLRRKLYDVNRWELNSGVSAFRLFDENGQAIETETAREGNFVRVTLPGSGKHDWVKIVAVHDTADELVITVRPTYDPTEKKTEEKVTSHFFTSDSRNNFCLQRKNTLISCCVIGLHEKPNTNETDSLIESARNAAAAALGWLGFQKIEWKTFCENFLDLQERR